MITQIKSQFEAKPILEPTCVWFGQKLYAPSTFCLLHPSHKCKECIKLTIKAIRGGKYEKNLTLNSKKEMV